MTGKLRPQAPKLLIANSWAGTLGARPHVLSLTSKALLLERWSYNIELMGGQTFVYLIEDESEFLTLAVADNENTLD